MISLGTIFARTCADDWLAKPVDFDALKKLAAQADAISPAPYTRIIVRDKKALDDMPASPARPSPFGIKVVVSKAMPATVKDKDGNEVELIGMLVSEGRKNIGFGRVDDRPLTILGVEEIVMLTGKIVKKKDGAP